MARGLYLCFGDNPPFHAVARIGRMADEAGLAVFIAAKNNSMTTFHFYIQGITDCGFTLLATNRTGDCVRRVEYRYDPDADGGRMIDFLYGEQEKYGEMSEISETTAADMDSLAKLEVKGEKLFTKEVMPPVIVEGRSAYKGRGFNGREWWVKGIPTIRNISEYKKHTGK